MKSFKNIHVGKSIIAVSNVATTKKVTPVKIQIDNDAVEKDGKIIPWGSGNDYPQRFYKKFLKNGAAVGGLGLLKAAINGNGFHLYKKLRDADNKIVLDEQLLDEHPEIMQFARLNNLDKLFFAKITDQAMWQMAFTEHVISVDFEKIVRVKRQKTAHCRFGAMENGIIKYVYINTNWAEENPKLTVPVRYFSDDYTVEEIREICTKEKIYNFITCSAQPMVDESYYIKTDWHAVDRNGWMDVANSVPELKQAIFENQLHFKYIVYISDLYFESYYKDEWNDFDAEKRQSMREELARVIDDHMSGNKSAGRSLTAPIFEEGGKFVKGIEVVSIENKLKDGSFLPDASAANSEILWAQGVNPAIIGAGTPGGTNLSGSGSNIREAYTVLSANQVPKRLYVLDDWRFWQEWNKWDTDLIGSFPGVNLTTLDKNPSGQENIIHS